MHLGRIRTYLLERMHFSSTIYLKLGEFRFKLIPDQAQLWKLYFFCFKQREWAWESFSFPRCLIWYWEVPCFRRKSPGYSIRNLNENSSSAICIFTLEQPLPFLSFLNQIDNSTFSVSPIVTQWFQKGRNYVMITLIFPSLSTYTHKIWRNFRKRCPTGMLVVLN